MKTRNCGIAVTAAALLLMALLVTNCSDPLDITNQIRTGGRGTTHIVVDDCDVLPGEETGRGTISLSVDSNNARTIIPTVPDFEYYVVTIRAYNPDNLDSRPPHEHVVHIFDWHVFTFNASSSVNIDLPAGWYTIDVFAYVHGDPGTQGTVEGTDDIMGAPTGTRAARGTSAPIEVYVGGNNEANVTLAAIFTGSGLGRFAWNLTLPGTLDAAYLMVVSRTSKSHIPGSVFAAGNTANVNAGGISNVYQDLTVGFYDVTLTLRRAGHQDRILREVMHIAQGLTSTWSPNIPDLINLQRTITFVNWDGRAASTREVTYMHGQMLWDNIADFRDDFYPQPTFYRTPHRHWLGWWTTPATGGFQWDPRPTDPIVFRIITNRTLFARWEPLITVAINVQPVNVDDLFPEISDVSISMYLDIVPENQGGSALGNQLSSIRLTFDATGFTPGSIIWRSPSGAIIPHNPATDAGNLHERTLSLSDNEWAMLFRQEGPHVFHVEAVHSGTAFSGRARFNVVDDLPGPPGP